MKMNFLAHAESDHFHGIMQIHPYSINVNGQEFTVAYLPGESDSGMFGGNSNWRGPVWMPVNALIIRCITAILYIIMVTHLK